MSKVSIIIPARHELYLQETVQDIFEKATGDIEVIVVLDGYWPEPILDDHPNLTIIHRERMGMRAAINGSAAIAKGKYLMKVDAHCMFAEGFDEALQADCEDNWVVIPRRYSLDVDKWCRKRDRPKTDYEYLAWPWHGGTAVHGSKVGLHAKHWGERKGERAEFEIDENMSFQGSCWFMPAEHLEKRIGKLQEEGYGTFIGEPQEIGLKTWLGGGKIMTNKRTWYAHLWKGKPYRERFKKVHGFGYTRIGYHEREDGNAFSVDFWMNNRWKERKYDIEWLVERFWPVPTWPEDRGLWIP